MFATASSIYFQSARLEMSKLLCKKDLSDVDMMARLNLNVTQRFIFLQCAAGMIRLGKLTEIYIRLLECLLRFIYTLVVLLPPRLLVPFEKLLTR